MPVSEVLQPLLDALQHSPCVLLQAPPGAGKSTWLPLKLLEQSSWLSGRIIMLEPRRLAARSVAQRLAQQLNQPVGENIGYRMRSESLSGPETRLEVVTEGVLIRMLQQDPMLEDVSLVILDEFHERSLQADLALSLLLDVQSGLRDDLKLLIMSATLDNQRLQQFLPDAPVISAEGRSFPVERHYLSLPASGYFEDKVAQAVRQIVNQHSGSMLLFLPGVAEIRRVCDLLSGSLMDNLDLCPLYGALSLAEQQKAISPSPSGRRKIVLATNIAETSLTIDGINLVVDSGLERVARFDPRTGLTRLITQRISKASMTQRVGRAGRLSAGACWHLFSREQAERAAEQGEAEIMQSDLSGLTMELLQWGCRDIQQMRWLDSPPATSLAAARRLLIQLDAVDEQGNLTQTGRQMAETGCEPRLAAMLVYAKKQKPESLATALLLTAIVEEPPRNGNKDISYWLLHPQAAWTKRARQLGQRLKCRNSTPDSDEIPFLLAAGFADRIAQKRGEEGRYLLANGMGAQIDTDDGLWRSEWLIAASLLQGANSPDARMLLAAKIDPEVLVQRMPTLVVQQSAIEWDEEKGTLRAWQRQQIGRLVLKAQPLTKPSEEQLHAALLEWIRTQGISALVWDEEAVQLRTRIQRAQEWLPQYPWPSVDDSALLETLETWLLPSLKGVRDIKGLRQVNLSEALIRKLDWQQRQRLDSELPVSYCVPTGSRLPIRYDSERPPVLAVRLQEMFGEKQTPVIADGRISLVVELLSPAHRPLQITQDLAAFWQGAYKEVQKEMKGRYPKHVWPDDPANALPTRKTKRFHHG
ncbi:ATP-dependent helicase HrpB [Budviciaceae bacterium BWR-B9]|uniref:ATP-dependent helicase HrpB n=1 Tax=Limnobaculum allomyrinae TaxID=2791986 RepID=A0ABS1IT87_9GAMM|nr:ATP-dependent helicase HrpB [Limnobaculum allomyrinae]MBV7692805.1 ATP-dependent helicase HrpB [Limnobaculum sp. M2-1]